jgi:hypothetical protein
MTASRRTILLAGWAALAALALAGPAPRAARADGPGARVAGLVSFDGETYVLVKNEGPAPATFEVALVDRLGRRIGVARVVGLGPGRTRTLAFAAFAAPGLEARVLPLRAAAAAAPVRPPLAFALEPTALTGLPPGIRRDAWNLARGDVRATPLEDGRTSFEIRASGLRPGGLYSAWWVDGTFSPDAGPLATPPANELRADEAGRASLALTAAFAARAHERVVLAFHARGGSRDASRAEIGKTIFAQLVGRIPPAPRARAQSATSPPREEDPCPLDEPHSPPRSSRPPPSSAAAPPRRSVTVSTH